MEGQEEQITEVLRLFERKAEQTLYLIECMKLFNTISVGVSGRLVRFAVDNGTLVDFDQPIAYIQ